MPSQHKEDEALTGILSTDVNESNPEHKRTSTWGGDYLFLQKIGVIVALLALLGAVVGLSVGFSRARHAVASSIDPACLHALGGGSIRSGGGIDSTAPEYCKAQLQAYARPERGSYWREVDIAMVAAMAVFGFAHKGSLQSTTHIQTTGDAAVSGFSRSLLAAQHQVAAMQQQQPAALHSRGVPQLGGPVAAQAAVDDADSLGQVVPEPGRDKVVVFDIDETVLSNMDQILDPVAWPWDKWVAAAQAPALQPSLRFYRALCAGGYSVAFVTGRKESSRNSTMHNLETAGYGKPCKPGPGPFYGVMSSGSSSSSSECCYSALYLRQQGDTQLASVYKPGARQDLLTKGNMTLMALVGDQFSDLNGEHSAPFAFKLPNPFYYIL